jgi:hypothetical protein
LGVWAVVLLPLILAVSSAGQGRAQKILPHTGGWAENYGSGATRITQPPALGASDIAPAQFMTKQLYISKGKWVSIGVSGGLPYQNNQLAFK